MEVPEDAASDEVNDIVDNLPADMLEEAWNAEVSTWAEMGMNPSVNIGADLFLLKSQVDILFLEMSERLDIDLEALDERLKRHMLKNVMLIRRQIGRQALQAKLMEGIVPQVPKDIFLPPGMKNDQP